MRIVEATQDQAFLSPDNKPSFSLTAGCQYVMYDVESQQFAQDGHVREVRHLNDVLPLYQGQSLDDEHLLIFFSGGLGDAVVIASCLLELKTRFPDISIDISCKSSLHTLWTLLDPSLHPVSHPVLATDLKKYAYQASTEDVGTSVIRNGRSNLDIFSQWLCIPDVTQAFHLVLPDSLYEQWPLGQRSAPRVGIAMTNTRHTRAYPVDLSLLLARELIRQEYQVYLLGLSRDIDQPLPHAPPFLCNYIDRTTDVSALAALLGQLDLLICPDTFFMHLAGVLRIDTLAIFTSSEPEITGGYPTVFPIYSELGCSPCGGGNQPCPLACSQCQAPYQADLQPSIIAQRVIERLGIIQQNV